VKEKKRENCMLNKTEHMTTWSTAPAAERLSDKRTPPTDRRNGRCNYMHEYSPTEKVPQEAIQDNDAGGYGRGKNPTKQKSPIVNDEA